MDTACDLHVRRRPQQAYRGLLPRVLGRSDDELELRCITHDVDIPLEDTSPENIVAVANAHRRGVRMARGPIN